MLKWIAYGSILISILVVLVTVVRLIVIRSETPRVAAQRENVILSLLSAVRNDQLWSVLTAFCRSDFLERRLLVSVEKHHMGSFLEIECKAAPYGVSGPFWKFGVAVFLRDGREVVQVWVFADPNGRHVSFMQELTLEDDDRYRQAKRFIELPLPTADGWKAYPHEQARVLVDTFFGPPGPTRATSCFDDEHIREAEVVPSTLSST